MKKFFGFLLIGFLFLPFSNQAQCPGCVVRDSLCDPMVAGQICGDTLLDASAGLPYEDEFTFKFPRRVIIEYGDTIPGLGFPYPPIPTMPPFPSFPPTVIMNILSVKVIVSNLPGLQWQCDSSTNGCEYIPSLTTQYGCVKICGDVDCDSSGNYPVSIAFIYEYDTTDLKAAFSAVSPIFSSIIPNQIIDTVTYTVGLNVNSAVTATLNLTADKPLVIGLGESITLTATGGFNSYAWSTGETTAAITATPSQSTTYQLTVTDANGCMQQSSLDVTVIPPAAVSLMDISKQIQILPNPTSGEFIIKAPAISDDVFFELTDISGKRIHADRITGFDLGEGVTIFLPTLKAGIYLMHLRSQQITATKKIIVQ